MSHSTRHHPLSAWLLGLSLAALPAVSHATHSWGGYHWASTTRPVALMLGDNMTADWSNYLYQASTDWDAGAQDAFTNSVVTGTSNKRCAAVTGTTQVCNGAYGTNGWLGLATISITGTHITKGTAKMNDTYFQTATYNNPNEKLHVVCRPYLRARPSIRGRQFAQYLHGLLLEYRRQCHQHIEHPAQRARLRGARHHLRAYGFPHHRRHNDDDLARSRTQETGH